jgi:hypothetical protein
MGWTGDMKELVAALEEVGADSCEEGFLIKGDIWSFMGAGDDVVVDDNARYRLNGEERPLVELLKERSDGLEVEVIAQIDKEVEDAG